MINTSTAIKSTTAITNLIPCSPLQPLPTVVSELLPAVLSIPNDLQLLQQWTGSTVGPIAVTSNASGIRGAIATRDISTGSTILLLPWKYVLGVRAALRLLEEEESKGRGMIMGIDDDNDAPASTVVLLTRSRESSATTSSTTQALSIRHCYQIMTPTQRWSTIMACALLSAAKYPLSSWGSYVSSLPCHSLTMEQALRRCHAWTVRYQLKSAMMTKPHSDSDSTTTSTTTSKQQQRRKLTQIELQQLKHARDVISKTPRDMELQHVLLWDKETLIRTGDVTLIQLVQQDWIWLQTVWEDIGTSVSWDSWLWAHAIVWSRAVGLEHAPESVITYNDDGGSDGTNNKAEGALLPIFDMINHHGTCANSIMEIRDQGVAIVTTQDIAVGREVFFNYHPNATIRFMLRGYGFIPTTGPYHQVFRVEQTNIHLQISIISLLHEEESNCMVQLERVNYQSRAGSSIMTFVLTDRPMTSILLEHDAHVTKAAVGCCRIVRDSIIGSVNGYRNLETIADQYRECNISLLERCIGDLESVLDLYTL